MQTIRITERWASVYVSPEEMRMRAICPQSVSESDVRSVLTAAQLPPEWNDVELELYPGKEDLLIFVRCGNTWAWYGFSDLETLLGAAAWMRETGRNVLYHMDGMYILGLYGGKAPGAEEFGTLLPAGKNFEDSLREHGKEILPENAVSVLKRTFLENPCNAPQV